MSEAESNVPPAVRRRSEEMKKLHEQVYGKPGEPAKQDTSDTPPKEPVAQQQHASDEPPALIPDQPPAPPAGQDGPDYKAAYEAIVAEWSSAPFKALKGKYNAEVPRLFEENKQLKEQLQQSQPAGVQMDDSKLRDLEQRNQQLQEQVRQLQEQAQQSQQQAQQKAPQLEGQIVERLRDEFGDTVAGDLTEFVRAQIQQATGGNAAQPQGQQRDPMKECDQNILAAIPEFDSINRSPEWNRWLDDTKDQATGLPMRTVIQRRYANADDVSVIAIVNQFLAHEEARLEQQHQGGKPVTPGDINEQVAPPRGPQGREPVSQQQYTQQDWSRHMEEKRRSRNFTIGPWAGRSAEWHAKQQAIHASLTGGG